MIVKDVESTNTIVRQIDNLTSAANDTEEDNVDQLFNSDASANNDLGFSSLLIAVGGNDLAISSNKNAALKHKALCLMCPLFLSEEVSVIFS
jgi:preprotein translocase subunit SecD